MKGDAIYREELSETRLDRRTVQVVCSRCGNNTFTATKTIDANEKAEGLLAHDFFGWEISDMGIRCAKCGGEPKLDIQPMPNGEALEFVDQDTREEIEAFAKLVKKRRKSGTAAARSEAE